MKQKSDGTILIDGFKFTMLSIPKDIMHEYHKEIEECVSLYKGQIIERTGDGAIASGFPDIDEAVRAVPSLSVWSFPGFPMYTPDTTMIALPMKPSMPRNNTQGRVAFRSMAVFSVI